MKIKKFLSVFLCFTLLLNPFLRPKVYADTSAFNIEDCVKNSNGGYESLSCARIAAKNILKNESKDYVVMKDVGPLANQEIYYFTFRAFDKILDKLGLDPDEDRLNEEWETFKKERNSYFSTLKNILRVGLGSLIGALGGNGLYSLARSEGKKHHRDRIRSLRRPVRTISKLGVGAMRAIGAACVGLITLIWLKIKYDSESKKGWEIFDKSYKVYKLNGKKADPLNRMLQHIKGSNYSLDENFFTVHTMPKDIWKFASGNLEGLNFTEEEKALFPEKLKKLAEDLEKNLGRRLEQNQ